MKQIALGLVASILSGVYWWAVFILVYADVLFAGDRNPALPSRPEKEMLIQNGITIVIGLLIYAVLAILWRRTTIRWQG